MLTLHVKEENIEELEDGRTVNRGGRTIRADESPTGEEIQPGSTFEAPEGWYESRRHWHFLTVKSKTDERTPENPLVINEPRRDERAPKPANIATEDDAPTLEELEGTEYRDLQGMCKDLGLSAGGSTDVLIDRLAEFYGIATDEEE